MFGGTTCKCQNAENVPLPYRNLIYLLTINAFVYPVHYINII